MKKILPLTLLLLALLLTVPLHAESIIPGKEELSESIANLSSSSYTVALGSVRELAKEKEYDVIAENLSVIKEEIRPNAAISLLENKTPSRKTYLILVDYIAQINQADAPSNIGEPEIADIIIKKRIGRYLSEAAGLPDQKTNFESKKSIDELIAKLRLSPTP